MSTDYQRWSDASTTFGAKNPGRAEQVASFIPDDVHVLDIGAGAMLLKEFLKPGCRYTPSDIHDRGEGCIVADLNKGEFPDGRYDWVTMIGVLEYLVDPRSALAAASQSARNLFFTYV